MKEQCCYYRIKTEWTAEKNDGSLVKTKTEELALVSSYTEAEQVAYALSEKDKRTQFGDDLSFEIIKTNISSVLFNSVLAHDNALVAGLVLNYFEEGEETGVGLYAVKIMYIMVDEKGKEKRSCETIYTPAVSNTDAANHVKQVLESEGTTDFVIRDIKFDKASSILWTPETQKIKSNDLGQF